jgi:phospholipid/cholesterol/gamma-HCH transport system substrate-binding protein
MQAPKRREVAQGVLLRTYGVVFLVVLALLVGLTVAIYDKVFVDVVHVTLQTDRVGNQLAPPADVKLRGMIVGEVRSVSSNGRQATVDLALQPRTVGLIPANVTARLLPKTLFGEKFVDLQIPARPSQARLAEGAVITQDRTSTAIELERVLDNLLPLLRTINPAKLNATLNALATALEGRGERLGENLELVDGYFTRLNPQLPTIQQDLLGLADVSEIYADAAPDLVRMLRNFAVTTSSIKDKSQVYAGFLAGTTGFATTTRGLLDENGDRLIRLASVGRPTLALLARYSPEYPCLLQGLAQSNDLIGRTFANGELHITLEVTKARAGYKPGEEPAWGENRGPSCYGLPNPARPWPGNRFRDGTKGDGSASALPTFLLDPQSGTSGSREEQGVVDALVSPQMGVPAGDVPDVATLLFGPMARGTAVDQS